MIFARLWINYIACFQEFQGDAIVGESPGIVKGHAANRINVISCAHDPANIHDPVLPFQGIIFFQIR